MSWGHYRISHTKSCEHQHLEKDGYSFSVQNSKSGPRGTTGFEIGFQHVCSHTRICTELDARLIFEKREGGLFFFFLFSFFFLCLGGAFGRECLGFGLVRMALRTEGERIKQRTAADAAWSLWGLSNQDAAPYGSSPLSCCTDVFFSGFSLALRFTLLFPKLQPFLPSRPLAYPMMFCLHL